MKETVGLAIQAISFALLAGVVLRRQLNDLFIKETDAGAQFTKNVLFGGAIVVTFMCSVGLIRLLYIAVHGSTTWLLDDATFWANRALYLANAVIGVTLYRNKRET
jgi:hypothetical protein